MCDQIPSWFELLTGDIKVAEVKPCEVCIAITVEEEYDRGHHEGWQADI